MKLRLLFLLFVLLAFFSCKEKAKVQEQRQLATSDEIENANDSIAVELANDCEPEDKGYLPIGLNIHIDRAFEKEEFIAYKSSDETMPEDTIAVSIFEPNDQVALLAKNLELGKTWLGIIFPTEDDDILVLDTAHTVKYTHVTDGFDYYTTTLSAPYSIIKNPTEEYRKAYQERLLCYNIAFKGNYTQADFHFYKPTIPSYNDSLYVMTTIIETMDKAEIKSPYIFSDEPQELMLKKMEKLKDDLFIASFYSGSDEYSDCNDMVVANGKVILWTTAYFGVSSYIFCLAKQDYIYTERISEAASSWDVYALDGDRVKNIYKMAWSD